MDDLIECHIIQPFHASRAISVVAEFFVFHVQCT